GADAGARRVVAGWRAACPNRQSQARTEAHRLLRLREKRLRADRLAQPAEVPTWLCSRPASRREAAAARRLVELVLLQRIDDEVVEHARIRFGVLVADHLVRGVTRADLTAAVRHQVQRLRQ